MAWDLMEDFERMMSGRISGTLMPSLDMYRSNGNLVIEIDMPGIEKKDIDLRLTEDSLSVSADRKEKKEEKREGFYRSERSWKSYSRSAALPVSVDPKKAEAKYENGTLRVTVPLQKMEEEKQARVNVE